MKSWCVVSLSVLTHIFLNKTLNNNQPFQPLSQDPELRQGQGQDPGLGQDQEPGQDQDHSQDLSQTQDHPQTPGLGQTP